MIIPIHLHKRTMFTAQCDTCGIWFGHGAFTKRKKLLESLDNHIWWFEKKGRINIRRIWCFSCYYEAFLKRQPQMSESEILAHIKTIYV